MDLTQLSDIELQQFMEEEKLSPEDMARLVATLSGPRLKHPLVDIEEFILSEHYLGGKSHVYPLVLEELKVINSGRYTETVLTGGIGAAKTTISVLSQLYQTYVLCCYENPHLMFDLDPSDEIEIVFQSVNLQKAKEVGYDRFKHRMESSPWFRKYAPFNPGIKSKMELPNRIIIKPVTGSESGAMGENVIGGVIDELNFMSTVENSKLAGDGGLYDQAVSNYQSIARRRESRFMQQGNLPGMLCLSSSARFTGQFTDTKIHESSENPRIYVYKKTIYEIRPERFSTETFDIFPGSETEKPFIPGAGQELEEHQVKRCIQVPIDFRPQFEADILNALRDIAGVSTTALHPFIVQPDLVTACFNKRKSVFSRDLVDFEYTQLEIYPRLIESPQQPRFIHIDLAVTSDSCGFCVGWVSGFKKIDRGEGIKETLPIIEIDGLLEVAPPPNGEIIFSKVRNIVYLLSRIGMNVRWVTFDSYQSTDSKQKLAQKGYSTGIQSVDKNTLLYDITKTALYDGRVRIPRHDKCLKELVTLERDEKRGKIDHRPNGSKDCADALAAVVGGLSRRREIWVRHGIRPNEIPPSLRQATPETNEKYREVVQALMEADV